MTKAVVVTRGRTGSSAITQELGSAPRCRSEQEIFGLDPGTYYHDFPAFRYWWEQHPELKDLEEAEAADLHLEALEQDALARGCDALFWKALSVHFVERPYLAELLKRRGYEVLYLTRDAIRQVLSGMIANSRNLYNSYEKIEDRRRYPIDIDNFRVFVRWERHSVEEDLKLLASHEIPVFPITYEDYLADRRAFFARIYTQLGLAPALPQPSRFQVMIDDLGAMIENYAEVLEVAAELDEPLEGDEECAQAG